MAIEKGRSLADIALAKPSVEVTQLDLMFDFRFAVQDLMDAEGINRKELAKRMRKSPSALTRILGGDANITLKTLAEFINALGLHVDIYSGLSENGGTTESLELQEANDSTLSAWELSTENNIEQIVRES